MANQQIETRVFDISTWLHIIDQRLTELVSSSPLTEGLRAVVQYAVLGGGKRVRPLLSLAICSDIGGNPQDLLRIALALELLHCSSLIHDDLPALDNDDYRRGRPSAHKQFGEAQAILAGDAMIGMISECFESTKLSPAQCLACYHSIMGAYRDLCSGQYLDLQPSERLGSRIDRIHELKTGSLFASAAEIAAIVSGVGGEQGAAIVNLGKSLGVYFQFVDDYRDRYLSLADTGKSKKSDEVNQRATPFTNLPLAEGRAYLAQKSKVLREELEVLVSWRALELSSATESICSIIESGTISKLPLES
jgi:geranylgeranyl diphosphate synthase, type II